MKNELKIFKKYAKDCIYNVFIFKLTDKKEFDTDETEIQSIIGMDTFIRIGKIKGWNCSPSFATFLRKSMFQY